MFQFDQADQFEQLAQHFPIIKDRIRFDQASGDSSSHRKVDTATLCSLPGKSFHFLSFSKLTIGPIIPLPLHHLVQICVHFWISKSNLSRRDIEEKLTLTTKVVRGVSGYWWIFAASHLSAFNSSWNRFASGLQFSSQVIVHWPLCALCALSALSNVWMILKPVFPRLQDKHGRASADLAKTSCIRYHVLINIQIVTYTYTSIVYVNTH